jgi:hypothetical protein
MYESNISSIQWKMGLRRSTNTRTVNPLSLIIIYINIPALTPGLHWAETALVFWQQTSPFDLSRTDKCRRQRGLGKHQVVGGGPHVCIYLSMLYKVGDRTEPWGTPARISLGVDISSSTETMNLHCERKELMSFIKLVENSNLDNLYSKPECHVVSKAFSMSKNTAP